MRCEYVAADVLQLRQPLQQKRESVGLGGGGRAGEQKGERWRRNTREEEEGSGRRDATRRDATRDRFRVVQRPPRRTRERFFSLRADHDGLVRNVFNPGL
jgi:hypothetical protein